MTTKTKSKKKAAFVDQETLKDSDTIQEAVEKTSKKIEKKSKVVKSEKTQIKKTFEDDIIKHLKEDKTLGIEVGFMTETGSDVEYYLDTKSYSWNFLSSGRLNGGLPIGRVVEAAGNSSVGKSLMGAQIAVQAQLADYVVIYFDIEKGMDTHSIERLGGKPSSIIVPTGINTIEKFNETFNKIIEKISLAGNTRPVVVILDSLAMLSSKHEIESPDKVDYSKPKKLKQFFRMYMDLCYRHNVLLFVINQVYDVIGAYVPTTVSSGGKAIQYASSQRYLLSTPQIEKGEDKDAIATVIKAKTLKNRVSIPFRSCFIKSSYKDGFDRYFGLFELLFDGNAGKSTGFNLIVKVKKDEKGTGWVESKTGTKYMLKGVIVDEEGKDIAFSQKDFIDLLKKDEEKYINKIQELIDKKNDDIVPSFEDLTDEEKLLVGDEVGDRNNDEEKNNKLNLIEKALKEKE